MTVAEEYLSYKNDNRLSPGNFGDRVKLQLFLRDKVELMWSEGMNFSHGGLQQNYMTGFSLGFAYYDCRPTPFCRTHCYGLPLAGVFDYNMLRLGVVTSESFRNGDSRFLSLVKAQLFRLNLPCLKIGHWGDAVPEQAPHIARLVSAFPATIFWWYTRRPEVATAANRLELPNLRCYLSLDPETPYPAKEEYRYGITYLYHNDHFHEHHDSILRDDRLVAIFSMKKGQSVEDPADAGLANHPRICIEKKWKATRHEKGDLLCLQCQGRCNFTSELAGDALKNEERITSR